VDRNKFPQMNWLDAPLYPISSTMIRERLKRGESIDDLVPFSVEVIEELINKKVD
jgi:nicotinic acid mononucleotide adenylyltransferase